ncbi:hypothetical protein DEO72_LG9g980 [Vigna unguiculata]|uniref:Uncharacterized protein n=1 Tax=Vigna unguiculata TaxID=3917 RepID=A0A4D6MZC6_VIGUN|nr:hypothetical protein DEO72_LG9g980 [Vigna unguiculata]
MKNPSVSSCGAGGSRSLGLPPIYYCGEKSVLRTMKTAKNKEKQFWGGLKYKGITVCFIFAHNGSEDGWCNYFKWWNEDAIEERGNSEKCEGRPDSLVKSEESDGDRKMVNNLEKSVQIFEKWMKVLIVMVIFVYVVNI